MFGSSITLPPTDGFSDQRSHDGVQRCGKVTFQEQESQRLAVFVRTWQWSGEDGRLHVETRRSRWRRVLRGRGQGKDGQGWGTDWLDVAGERAGAPRPPPPPPGFSPIVSGWKR